MKMQQMGLEEIKKTANEILIHFSNFCKENQISFYLSNGTLLGAIKYKGFIPWDDDIDVLMPREDYDRFIKMYIDTKKYVLFTRERNLKYNYPFAKLGDMSTRLEEINIDNGVELGVNMDIFPIDKWAPEKEKAEKQMKRNKSYIKKLGYTKTIHFKPSEQRSIVGQLIRICAKPVFNLIGPGYFCNKMSKVAIKHRHLNHSPYLGCIIWPVYGKKEIVPAEVFDNSVEVIFEGEMYPAPIGFEKYLCSLYGNYKEDPPLEKQATHHNFVAYKLVDF